MGIGQRAFVLVLSPDDASVASEPTNEFEYCERRYAKIETENAMLRERLKDLGYA